MSTTSPGHTHGPHASSAMAKHRAPASWRMAMAATTHCLIGCAIGEVAGMAIGTALGWGAFQTIALAVLLAFVFGYLLTLIPLRRQGLPVRAALKVALAADTLMMNLVHFPENGRLVHPPMHPVIVGFMEKKYQR